MRTSTARPYGNVPFPRPTRFVIKHFVMRVVEGADPYKYYAAFTVGGGAWHACLLLPKRLSRCHPNAKQMLASVGMFLSRRRHPSVALRHLPLGEITLTIRRMTGVSITENMR